MDKYGKKELFIINAVFYALIGGIVFGICKYILPVLVPFILAFFIAVLIQIPVRKFSAGQAEKKRVIAVVCCICFFVIFFALVMVLGVKLLQGTGGIIAAIPEIYQDRIAPVIAEIAERLEELAASVDILWAQKIEEVFGEFSENVGQYITDFSMGAVKSLSERATQIPEFVVKLVVTVVSTFFMAVDFEKIISFVRKWISAGREESVEKTVIYAKNVIFIYLKSYSFLCMLTFAELLVGFWILRVPYAGLIALSIAVFDILPVLGTGGILLPWSALLCLLGDFPLAFGILVLYIVITIIRNTLEPKIVGKQIGLHPLATLILMFIGLNILGIAGMIILPVGLSVLVNLEKNGVIHLSFWKKAESNV